MRVTPVAVLYQCQAMPHAFPIAYCFDVFIKWEVSLFSCQISASSSSSSTSLFLFLINVYLFIYTHVYSAYTVTKEML